MNDAPNGRCLGLIGGLGVGATVHYYRELTKAHGARGTVLQLLSSRVHLDAIMRSLLDDPLAEGAGPTRQ